jgi:hypothetical protein
MRSDIPDWFDEAFTDLIMRGYVEVTGISEFGDWLFAVSDKGREYMEKKSFDPQAIWDDED